MSQEPVRATLLRVSALFAPVIILIATLLAYAFRGAGVEVPGVALAAFVGVTIIFGAFQSGMAWSVATSAMGVAVLAFFLSGERPFVYGIDELTLLLVVVVTFPAIAIIVGLMRLGSERMTMQLQEAEKMWKLLAAEVPSIVMTMSDDGRVYFANHPLPWLPANSDPRGSHLLQLLPEASRAVLEKSMQRVWSSGEEVRTEIAVPAPNDTMLRYDVRMRRVMQDNESMALIATFVDVTDRQSEEEAHERLAAVVDASTAAIFGLSKDGVILSWNPGATRMYGYTEEEIVGSHLSALFPEGRSSADAEPFVTAALRGDRTERAELTHRRKDGTPVLVAMSLAPIEHHGAVTGISAIVRDLTKQRRNEEERRRLLALMAEAEKVAGVGSWEWDLASNTMTWSDGLFRIYGHDPATVRPSFDGYLQSIEPTDRERVRRTLLAAREVSAPFSFDQRILRDDGVPRVLRVRGLRLMDEHGRPSRLIGAAHDVTEQRLLESELQSEVAHHRELLTDVRRRLSVILEHAPILVWATDKEGVITLMEGKALSLAGIKPEDRVGKSVFDIYKEVPALIAGMKVALSGKSVRDTLTIRGRRYDITAVPLAAADGAMSGLIGFAIDVTDSRALDRKPEGGHDANAT